MADEKPEASAMLELEKLPFFVRLKRWFKIGGYAAAGIAGLGFGVKKLSHQAEDPGRSPDSITSPLPPSTAYVLAGLAEFRKEYEVTIRAIKDEQQVSREERKFLRVEANTNNQQFGERLGRVEKQIDEIGRDVKDIARILRESPKLRADVSVINPNKKAN